MSTSAPLPQESGSLTPSFAGADPAETLAWRQARLRAITTVRARDWPLAWKGFEQARSGVQRAEDAPFEIGLRADMSHTDWLSGHHAQALQGFALAMAKAEALNDSRQRAPLLAVMALVLAGLNQDMAGEARPDAQRLMPGSCSDPAHWPDEPTPPELAWLQLLRLEERLSQSDLFHAHGDRTAQAPHPLIRWYYRQLAIRKLAREDKPAQLMPHLLAGGRAFRALGEAQDTTDSRPDGHDPLTMDTLAAAVLPPLVASLILQQGGTDLPSLLGGWAQDVAEPSPEAAMREWLAGAQAILHLAPEPAWEMMQDPEQGLDARLLAGLRALSGPVEPDRVFFMHCLVVLWAARPDAAPGTALLREWYPQMAWQAWQMLAAWHPALQDEARTGEALLALRTSPPQDWAGVRQILVTAQSAVHVHFSPAVLDAFATLTGEGAAAPPAETP